MAMDGYLRTFVAVQVFQGLGVGVDDVQVVLEPRHLAVVPGGFELPEGRHLMNQLLLLADPQRPMGGSVCITDPYVYKVVTLPLGGR
jgi:hypothetical protein